MRSSLKLSMAAVALACLFIGRFCLADEPDASGQSGWSKPWQAMVEREDARLIAELLSQAEAKKEKGEFIEALRAVEQAEVLLDKAVPSHHWLRVDTRVRMASLRKYEKLSDENRKNLVATNRGEAEYRHYEAKGNVAQAFETGGLSAKLRKQVLGEDDPETLRLFLGLALTCHSLRKYEEAVEFAYLAMKGRSQIYGDDHPQTAECRQILAMIFSSVGNYAVAEEIVNRAIKDYEKAFGPPSWLANCLETKAHIHFRLGEFELAESDARYALRFHSFGVKAEDVKSGQLHNALAAILAAQGQNQDAIRHLTRATIILEKVQSSNSIDIIMCLYNQGVLYSQLGLHEESRLILEELKEVVPEADRVQLGLIYRKLGDAYQALNNIQKAAEQHEKGLGLLSDSMGPRHPYTSAARLALAVDLHGLGNSQRAGELLEEVSSALEITSGSAHNETVYARTLYATHLASQGRSKEAFEQLELASRGYDVGRLISSANGFERGLAHRVSPRPMLAVLEARRGNWDAAWNAIERDTGKVLIDELQSKLSPTEAKEKSQIYQNIAQVEERIDALVMRKNDAPGVEQFQEALKQRDDLCEQLLAHQVALCAKYGPTTGQSFDRKRIQESVPPNAAIVCWVPVNNKSINLSAQPNEVWAFILLADAGPICLKLDGSGRDGQWTRNDVDVLFELRKELEAFPRDDKKSRQSIDQLLETSRRMLFEPIVTHLQNNVHKAAIDHFIVLPSPLLNSIPLHLLAPDARVTHAPSGTVYAWLREKRSDSGSAGGERFLGVGVTDFSAPDWMAEDDDQIRNLTFTEPEVLAVGTRFKNPTILINEQATDRKLTEIAETGELEQYRYLLFATHTEMNSLDPRYSSILLSRTSVRDPVDSPSDPSLTNGKLSVNRILRTWNLDSELVALSACQGALGKESRGEGFIGFSQALFVAGTRSALLSLWEVDDYATMLLTSRFFDNLTGAPEVARDPLSKAESLRQAQIWLRSATAQEIKDYLSDKLKEIEAEPDEEGSRVVVRDWNRHVFSRLARGKTSRDAESEKEKPEEYPPFAHPYFWAGFILVGDHE